MEIQTFVLPKHSMFGCCLQFYSVLFICLFVTGVKHERNLIWSQTDSLDGQSKLLGISGDPLKWVVDKTAFVRSISAPSLQWHFNSLAFDYKQETVFWSNSFTKGISGIKLNGSNVPFGIFTGTSNQVRGLAVDWIAENIYWTDACYNWIMVAAISWTIPRVHFRILVWTDLDVPSGLVLHPKKGFIFWNDQGRVKKIERASLSGLHRQTIVRSGLSCPSGMSLDYLQDRLFWVDEVDGTVSSVDLYGHGRRVHVQILGVNFSGIAVYKEFMFVIEQKYRQLYAFNKSSSSFEVSFSLANAVPNGIIMYNQSDQETTEVVCRVYGCDQMCVSTYQGKLACMCSSGFELMTDGKTCKENDKKVLLQFIYSIGTALCKFPVNFPDMNLDDVSLETQCFLTDRKEILALAFSTHDNTLYFFENGTKAISRLKLLEKPPVEEVILTGVGVVEGMSFDWIASKLYWTDGEKRRIMVSNSARFTSAVVQDERIVHPRGIAVDPVNRFLYWTDVGWKPHIEKSRLDGSHRHILLDSNMGSPNHITIDYLTKRLFWCDSKLGRIESMNFVGGDRKVVLYLPGSHIYSVTTFQDYIIWTDRENNNGIHAGHKETGTKIRGIIHPNVGVAYDVVTFDTFQQPQVSNKRKDESVVSLGTLHVESKQFLDDQKRSLVSVPDTNLSAINNSTSMDITPGKDRFTPKMNRSTPNRDQSASNVDRSTSYMGRSTPNRDQSTSNVDRSTSYMDRSTPNRDRSTSNVDRSTSYMNRSTSNRDRSTSNVDQHTSNMDQHTSNMDRSTFDMDQSTSDMDRSTLEVERSTVDTIHSINTLAIQSTVASKRPTAIGIKTHVVHSTVHTSSRTTIGVTTPTILDTTSPTTFDALALTHKATHLQKQLDTKSDNPTLELNFPIGGTNQSFLRSASEPSFEFPSSSTTNFYTHFRSLRPTSTNSPGSPSDRFPEIPNKSDVMAAPSTSSSETKLLHISEAFGPVLPTKASSFFLTEDHTFEDLAFEPSLNPDPPNLTTKTGAPVQNTTNKHDFHISTEHPISFSHPTNSSNSTLVPEDIDVALFPEVISVNGSSEERDKVLGLEAILLLSMVGVIGGVIIVTTLIIVIGVTIHSRLKIKSRAPRPSFQTTAGHPHDQIITSFGTNKEEEVDIGSDLPSSYHELYGLPVKETVSNKQQFATLAPDGRYYMTDVIGDGISDVIGDDVEHQHGDGSHQRATVKVPSRLIAHSLGIYGDSQQCSSTVDLCVRSPTAGFSTFLEDKTIKNGRSCEERYKFDRDDW